MCSLTTGTGRMVVRESLPAFTQTLLALLVRCPGCACFHPQRTTRLDPNTSMSQLFVTLLLHVGVAACSRNARLSPESRANALSISQAMAWAQQAVAQRQATSAAAIAAEVRQRITAAGGEVDYVQVGCGPGGYAFGVVPLEWWLSCCSCSACWSCIR